ncbi:hypothetical protein [Verrucomicrobium sp. BvORR034]|uniref:hypothetical protein n=1 Tax=Verrucomicrobium sp. BvORR034 TaxID=1396418 RepID=UPI00224103FF|nr:hypothetical protein [Verrucomicrobium sp. BvORR034]
MRHQVRPWLRQGRRIGTVIPRQIQALRQQYDSRRLTIYRHQALSHPYSPLLPSTSTPSRFADLEEVCDGYVRFLLDRVGCSLAPADVLESARLHGPAAAVAEWSKREGFTYDEMNRARPHRLARWRQGVQFEEMACAGAVKHGIDIEVVHAVLRMRCPTSIDHYQARLVRACFILGNIEKLSSSLKTHLNAAAWVPLIQQRWAWVEKENLDSISAYSLELRCWQELGEKIINKQKAPTGRPKRSSPPPPDTAHRPVTLEDRDAFHRLWNAPDYGGSLEKQQVAPSPWAAYVLLDFVAQMPPSPEQRKWQDEVERLKSWFSRNTVPRLP